MNNLAVVTKVKNRLNKLDSGDYDNIPDFQIAEAVNKAQFALMRRTLHGKNFEKEGDEQSKVRIDDFRDVLERVKLPVVKDDGFVRLNFPTDYFGWKRVDAFATTESCQKGKTCVVYLAEEDNLALLLKDELKKPSFKSAETFCTLQGDDIKIFTNNEFDISSVTLTYYRNPVLMELQGATNIYTGAVSAVDVELEFKDDLCELIIDEAVKILAGDIESFNQYQRASENVENNT